MSHIPVFLEEGLIHTSTESGDGQNWKVREREEI